MSDEAGFELPDAVVEAFRRDGAVPLRGVFAPWVEGARGDR